MGYATEFEGDFTFDKPLLKKHAAYLKKFFNTRRMKRNASIAEKMPDPVRKAAGLPIGEDGSYFVGGGGDFGQGDDESVIDLNEPPEGQPNKWCDFEIHGDTLRIRYGKTYCYVKWLKYIIKHFIQQWGYKLNGEVFWDGEESSDNGKIEVLDNTVSVYDLVPVYNKRD